MNNELNKELNAQELLERAKANNEIQEVKRFLYALKDLDMGFMELFESTNHMTALRSFAQACQDTKNVKIQANPEKYSLYYLGYYSSSKGNITAVEPMKLGEATSYAPAKQSSQTYTPEQ